MAQTSEDDIKQAAAVKRLIDDMDAPDLRRLIMIALEEAHVLARVADRVIVREAGKDAPDPSIIARAEGRVDGCARVASRIRGDAYAIWLGHL